MTAECALHIQRAVTEARHIVAEPGEHPSHMLALAWRVLRKWGSL